MREITGIADGPVMLSKVWEITELNLRSKGIGNISALAEMKNLAELNLAWNREISDISALSGLTNLTNLDLGGNKISDISALSELKNLEHVNLRNNPITDYSPVDHVRDVEK